LYEFDGDARGLGALGDLDDIEIRGPNPQARLGAERVLTQRARDVVGVFPVHLLIALANGFNSR
jgi:hypothetical protein